jgi:amino acid adenylation domain-containing protein
MQERLWLLQQLFPELSAYNEPSTIRMRGPLDLAALRSSLSAIIARHEVLRTLYRDIDGKPYQEVQPPAEFALGFTDLSQMLERERLPTAIKLATIEAERHLDLSKEYPLQAHLYKLDEEDHIFLWMRHHIASDGWSAQILWRELVEGYQAALSGREPGWPELPIQYADFAAWHRQWLQGENLERHLRFWRTALSGLEPAELPLDAERPAQPGYRGATVKRPISPQLAENLHQIARQEQVTLFMLLLAAFQVLLMRLTGQPDISVGVPAANRRWDEVENLVGFFINTLVVRVDFSNTASFRDALANTRQVLLDVYEHQDAPFEKLVEDLQPDRRLNRSPFFQSFFNLVRRDQPDAELGALHFERVNLLPRSAKFDFTLNIYDMPAGYELDLTYNVDLFSSTRMEELLDQYLGFLEQIVIDLDLPVNTYSLVTGRAKEILPDPQVSLIQESLPSVAVMVEEQAHKTPQAVAIQQGDRQWVYVDLVRQARKTAEMLVMENVQPGQVVALTWQDGKSFELIAALLGILMSGGVFFLLDPELPPARQQLLLDEAKATWLVTTIESRMELAWLGGAAERPLPRTTFEDLPAVYADSPAYIFFTSGSTGKPKGILGAHKGLSHFVLWQRQAFQVGAQDRVAQLIHPSFDAILRDIFLPLISGGVLCLPPASGFAPDEVLPWLADERVTIIHSVPSISRYWLQAAPQQELPRLRLVFLSGEMLSAKLAGLWRERSSPENGVCQVVNFYGPTETTMIKSYYVVPENPRPGAQPAGTALPQTQLLILNEAQTLCGIGEPGQIAIRTPYATLGYLSDTPEKTRFVPNPFRHADSINLYMTGDRGRYRPDGLVEVLGRLDEQVKVRGVLVEPQEVATILKSIPGVKDCAVVAFKTAQGETELAAYVVLGDGETLSTGELRLKLRQRLPLTMLPAVIFPLENIPLLSNGKVDRNALPIPELSSQEDQVQHVPPRTPEEALLFEIWSDILQQRNLGVYSNFFDLGGHSLLATQIVARIRQVFQVELPLHELFETPTISDLAARIIQIRRRKTNLRESAIEPLAEAGQSRSRGALSFSQQRVWFLDQLEPNLPTYNIPEVVRLRGMFDQEAFQRSLYALSERHSILRTSFEVDEDGQPVQVIQPLSDYRVNVVDLSGVTPEQAEEQARALLQQEIHRPFVLAQGNLLRIFLWKLEYDHHILLLLAHHTIYDAWSRRILWRDLNALYLAETKQALLHLPDLALQYLDYAAWQRKWLQSLDLQRQIDYWRQKLNGLAFLELPLDYPRPERQTYRGESLPYQFSEPFLQRLRDLARREHITFYMLMLAAFKLLLARLTNQSDITIGAPLANRRWAEVEELIGFFVNALVLRTDLSGDLTFRELLQRVRQTALEAYDNQDVPLEKLAEELQPERRLNRTPFFQIFFNLIPRSQRSYSLGELRVEPFEYRGRHARFDLTVYILDSPDHVEMRILYKADLFTPQRIQELLAQYLGLLEQALIDPGKKISAYSLLTPASKMILPDPTQPLERLSFPSLNEMIDSWIQQTPDAIAITHESLTWSYAGLGQRIVEWSHSFTESGIKVGERVAVVGKRSSDLIACVLGGMKVGAVVLMIDPDLPLTRQQQMIAESAAHWIIRLEDLSAGRVQIRPSENTPGESPQLDPEDAAYIFFTSGSSGKPKGILGSKQGLSHFIDWQRRKFEIGPGDRVGQMTSLSFDVALRDLFMILASGGTLHLPPLIGLGSEEVLPWAAQQQITILHCVPSVARFWLESAPAGIQLPDLRLVFFAGEVLHFQLVQAWRRIAPNCVIVNFYGPTETTLVKAFQIVPPDVPQGNVVVGKALPNAQLLVLDENEALCGIGETGQVVIRTPFTSLGYLPNVPEKERFKTNPFGDDPADRVYWTGDLGRYRLDGNLEILGRIDEQVKVRGVLVEPQEVRLTLAEHPQVAECFVTGYKNQAGETTLAAYVVLRPVNPQLSSADVRAYLRERLPDAFVPTAVMFLPHLPVLPNGKVDRASLPAPQPDEMQEGRSFTPPRNELESAISEVWQQLLPVEKVGAHDNFFDLGGHSLLAMRMIARLRQILQIEIPLSMVFQYPTVARLAQGLDDLRQTGLDGKAFSSADTPDMNAYESGEI